jgi:hypothetical protein
MENTQKEIEDWRKDISEPKDILKVAPDNKVIFTFQDEGMPKSSEDYGNSIVFSVKTENNETKLWYVKTNNFSLLGQIKALGKLTGLKAEVSRVGSKRSDTRYKIRKIE